ncbi:MAG: carbon-nitrogen family hydrolase [Deltaproteobacteria bacterium]|nr:MAG: carbon-nitrogen family hydrolase [Deltaproteobacteria bacterium]
MEQRTVTAAAIQFNITLGEIDRNLAKAEAALRRVAARGAQLAVLPEMWSSGFAYKKLPELAAQTPRVLEHVAALSGELGLTVVGSLPEPAGDRVYNTSFVVDRGQLAGSYRKLHLFSLMNEDEHIAGGGQSAVVATSAGKLGLAICYDLRFPELFRKLALDGAEIICLPGEWPTPRQLHWRTLLRARAIENQCFVIAANCCGRQGKLDFFGMSLIIAPRGELLAEADDFATELVAACDFREFADYRGQITCFRDRRPDVYGTLP